MFPIFHKTKLETWHVAVSLVFVWMSGIVEKLGFIAYPALVIDGKCVSAAGYGSYTRAIIAASINTVTQFFLPLTLILLMYCHMVCLLRKKARQVGPTTNEVQLTGQTTGNAQMMQASKNVTKTLIIVTMFFFFCWIWNSIFVLLFIDGSYGLSLNMPFYHFSTYMVFLNGIINPFIYTFKYREFRTHALKVFCKRLITPGGLDGHTSHSQIQSIVTSRG